MGYFKGLSEAQVTGGGVYFLPGQYRVRVTAVKMVQSRKSAAENFIIETEIIESDNTDRRAGMQASQVIKMGEVMSLSNIKKFIAAAVGVNPTDSDANQKVEAAFAEAVGRKLTLEQIAEYAISDENPLADTELKLNCFEIETRRGTPFTKHDWMPA